MNKKIFIILIPIALGAIGWGVWATSNPHSWTNGLIGYWSFDGQYTTTTSGTGAGTRDTSGNNNWGTFNGGVKPVGGISGQALSFDGVDDYVDVGTTFSLGTGSYSLEAWIKADALSANMMILSSYDTNVAQVDGWYLMLLTTGILNFRAVYENSPETTWEGAGSSALSVNTWYHIVAIRNLDADAIQIYVNGVAETVTESGTAPHNLNVDSARPRLVGAARKDSGGTGRAIFFNGLIDEVRIYNRALGAEEIKQHYEQTRRNFVINQPSGTPPVGWWKMDEPTGTQVRDYSANANNGTPTGTTSTDGKIGQALSFDGSDDYVGKDSGVSGIGGQNQMTYEVWIKRGSTGTGDYIYGLGNASAYKYQSLAIQSDNTIRADFGNTANNNYRVLTTTNTLTDTASWHHLVATYNAGTIVIYVDGVSWSGSYTGTWTGAVVAETTYLRIGGVWAGAATVQPFHGLIDDLRLYNYARTADQIASDYRAGAYRTIVSASVPSNWWTDGLVGYWSFDGQYTTTTSGTGAGTRDTSGNNNWGTFNGGVKPVGGISGQALSFDGVDDTVYKSSPSFIDDTTGSVEFWFKLAATNVDYVISSISVEGATGALRDEYLFLYYRGEVNKEIELFAMANGVQLWDAKTANSIVTDLLWHHWVVTSDGTTVKAYLDGTARTLTNVVGTNTGRWMAAATDADVFTLGAIRRDVPVLDYDGQIDEVRVYNRALGADEIKQHYEQTRRNLRL